MPPQPPSTDATPPEHGGRLRLAAARFGIPLARWLDLSAALNPRPWPIPAVPLSVWVRLPEEADGLEEAAAAYFGTDEPLPVAGSQAAIQALPQVLSRLFPDGPQGPAGAPVGVPAIGYQEHAFAWRRAGYPVLELPDGDPERLPGGLERLGGLVVIHPNNPTGRVWPVAHLLDWHARLASRGGWMILDEAFVDATPARSLAAAVGRPGLIVLRSLGKFFGLAGARVGCVLAEERVRAALRAHLGPWALSGPARWVAEQAYRDLPWQVEARTRLPLAAERLDGLLRDAGLSPAGGTALFQWVLTPDALERQTALARAGILVRRFDRPASLRFGLPGSEPGWQRLADALGVSAGERPRKGLPEAAPVREHADARDLSSVRTSGPAHAGLMTPAGAPIGPRSGP